MLRSKHHFKGLNKGCVLYTGASYTREITVHVPPFPNANCHAVFTANYPLFSSVYTTVGPRLFKTSITKRFMHE